jgi:dTDP-4-dehydrorhamnose 3,5-epimerase-like enzyme
MSPRQLTVRGVELIALPTFEDARGRLAVGEVSKQLPFQPQRFFLVFDVPTVETRGEHAHRECAQFLICVRGDYCVVVDDGSNREEVHLTGPSEGLLIPPGVWAIQHSFSADAMQLVFASHAYDPDDYIRDYAEYLDFVGMS